MKISSNNCGLPRKPQLYCPPHRQKTAVIPKIYKPNGALACLNFMAVILSWLFTATAKNQVTYKFQFDLFQRNFPTFRNYWFWIKTNLAQVGCYDSAEFSASTILTLSNWAVQSTRFTQNQLINPNFKC